MIYIALFRLICASTLLLKSRVITYKTSRIVDPQSTHCFTIATGPSEKLDSQSMTTKSCGQEYDIIMAISLSRFSLPIVFPASLLHSRLLLIQTCSWIRFFSAAFPWQHNMDYSFAEALFVSEIYRITVVAVFPDCFQTNLTSERKLLFNAALGLQDRILWQVGFVALMSTNSCILNRFP